MSYVTINTPVVPSTGVFTFTEIQRAFPNVQRNTLMTSYSNVHPSLAHGSPLLMTSFRGLTAVAPSLDAASIVAAASGVNCTVSLSNTTCLLFQSAGVSPSTPATATLSLANYVINAAFQGPPPLSGAAALSFTSCNFPSSASVSAGGILTIGATTALSTSNAALIVTNAWGNVFTVPANFSFLAIGPPTWNINPCIGTNVTLSASGAISGVVNPSNAALGSATASIDVGDAPDLVGVVTSLFFSTPPPANVGVTLAGNFLNIGRSNNAGPATFTFALTASNATGASVQPFTASFATAAAPAFSAPRAQVGVHVAMSAAGAIAGSNGPLAPTSATFSLGLTSPGSGPIVWSGVVSGALPPGWSLLSFSNLIIPTTTSPVASGAFVIGASNSFGLSATQTIGPVSIVNPLPTLVGFSVQNNGVTLSATAGTSNVSIVGTNSYGANAALTATIFLSAVVLSGLSPWAAANGLSIVGASNVQFVYTGGVAGYNSNVNLTATSTDYGTANVITISVNVNQSYAPTPVAAQSSIAYGGYTGSQYPITWVFNLTNVTTATFVSSTNISSTSFSTNATNTVGTLTGYVGPSTTPSATLNLIDSVSGYSVATASPTLSASIASPAMPFASPAPNASTNSPSYGGYNGSQYPVAWSFNIDASSSSLQSTNIGSSSYNNNTIAGYISPNTTPTATLYLVRSAAGYQNYALSPSFTANNSAPNTPYTSLPTASSQSLTYGSYNGSQYYMTWVFNVTASSSTLQSSANISSANYNNVNTLTGYVSPNATPSVTLSLIMSATGYQSSTASPSFSGTSAPNTPTAAQPSATANTPSYGAWNGSSYPVTWTFSVSPSTATSSLTLTNLTNPSYSSTTLTGYIGANSTPTATLSLTNAPSGYISKTASAPFTANQSSPPNYYGPAPVTANIGNQINNPAWWNLDNHFINCSGYQITSGHNSPLYGYLCAILEIGSNPSNPYTNALYVTSQGQPGSWSVTVSGITPLGSTIYVTFYVNDGGIDGQYTNLYLN